MNNIKLDVEVERSKTNDQAATKSRCHTNRIKEDRKIEFQLELKNRFQTLEELDDIDTMSETITDMMQQNALSVAKAINKPHKSRLSSPTRNLVTNKWRKTATINNE